MSQSVHAFLYCNPTSGGNQARRLLELPGKRTAFSFEERELGMRIFVKVFDLKTESSRLEGFNKLKEATEAGENVRVVAAGGDGTVKWVISELERISHVELPIGVIPFGTGNDMARILGWGSTAPFPLIGGESMSALKEIIRDLVMGEPLSLDVWRVETKCDPDHGRFDVAVKGEIVERKDKAKVVIDHMINYCSFGQDARAVFGFERNRRTSQFMNKVQFAIEGGKLIIRRVPRLTNTSMTVDDEEIPNIQKYEGIIFQNIPSYAAGSDFWDRAKKWTPGDKFAPQLVGDDLLEIHGLRRVMDIGLHKATLGSRDATSRLGQGKKMLVKFDHDSPLPLYFQVDGEPCMITGPVSCEISLAFQVTMISRNDAKAGLLRSLSDGSQKGQLLHAGYLLKARKHPKSNRWNSRFVALVKRSNGIALEWYQGKDLRDRIVLIQNGSSSGSWAKLDHPGKRSNTGFSVTYKKKTYYFAGKNERERDEWLNSFEKARGE